MVKVDSAASDSRDSIAAFFSTFKNPMFMAIVTEVISEQTGLYAHDMLI